MNIKAIRKNAQITLSDHRWTSVATYTIFSSILTISKIIPFGSLILKGVLNHGLKEFFLTKTNNIKIIFKGFKDFLKTTLTGIILAVYKFLWSLLFIIPGIIKRYSYALTYYILNENPELAVCEAIEISEKIMKGHKWELFVLDLTFLGWDILNILTLGILNILYIKPYKNYAYIEFYNTLKNK